MVSDIEERGVVSVQSVVDSVGVSQHDAHCGARISAVSPTVLGNETSTLDSHDTHHTSTTSLASTAQQLNTHTSAPSLPSSHETTHDP